MQKPISVTMSAYNVEPYLRECLDCVVNQTLRDIEIICVNDGSTDGTLAILKEYAARDSRIKIVDKGVNEGLAVARNEALALASGKYIGFVDGDDLLDRDLFRKAYECAEENQCDMLLWDCPASVGIGECRRYNCNYNMEVGRWEGSGSGLVRRRRFGY